MNIQDLNYLSMVRLDVSIWSARSKLRREDLADGLDLPPETMATLGSKRLFDPNKLTVFNTLKARAAGYLDKKCVRFLGGWATHESNLPDIARALQDISLEFDQARDAFMQHYIDGALTWANNFPEYRDVLLNAVPSRQEVARKFAFSWQMFKIAPAELDRAYAGNNLGDTLNSIESTLLEEIARGIRETYAECFDGKETVTRRAFRPVRTLIEKVRGLTFLHPHVVGLEQVLTQAVTLVEDHADSPSHVAMFKNFLLAMQSAAAIEAVCKPYVDAVQSIDDVFNPFWTAVAGPAPVPAPATTPVTIYSGEMTLEKLQEWHAAAQQLLVNQQTSPVITEPVPVMAAPGIEGIAGLAKVFREEPVILQPQFLNDAQRVLDAVQGIRRDENGNPLVKTYDAVRAEDEDGNPLPGIVPDIGVL